MAANPFDLTGKIALVTGGNTGLGLGMAKGLAQAGATLALADRNSTNATEAKAALEQLGARALTLTTDVTDKDAVQAMIDATVKAFGRIDILINNAGISRDGPVQDLPLDDWQATLDINLTAPFVCAQAVYPVMKAQGSGKIINIASILAQFASGRSAAYASSKGGIMQLTRALAVGWAGDNIQVNAIMPGWIDTDMTRAARERRPDLHYQVVVNVPVKRWGTPEDIAGTAVFLASPASDFVTGAGIVVDGGYSAAS